jgi:serine/threonine-protein kinase
MLPTGAQFAHYRIEALLGEGGMGQVYRAFDEKLHRRVALKVLTVSDAGSTERMVREARAAAALEHPNKVSVFELGEVDGTPYLAMELISGPTLRAAVGDRSVPWQDVVAWLLDAARALDAAHAVGLVHRDVKPDNVMLRDDGVVKVLDFGIARRAAVSPDASAPTAAAGVASATGGVIAGTAAYMAPEQVRGDALDGRCDQFAWAVMAFELLTGEHPWGRGREPLAMLSAMLTTRPRLLATLRPELPAKLSQVVARALSSDREERYPSMRALVSDVAPLVGQSERARAPLGVVAASDDLGSARTQAAPSGPSTHAPAAATAGSAASEPSAPRGASRVAVALAVVGFTAAAALVAYAARRASPAATASTAARTSVNARPATSLAVPSSAAPAASAPPRSREPVFACSETKRPLPAAGLDRTCSTGVVAWCNQSMRVVACCAKGLIPEGDEGACGCPPAGVEDPSKRPAGCPPSTLPPLAKEDIQKVVREHFGAMRGCYEAALRRSPKAEGKVAIAFEIDPAGEIFFARVNEGTLPDATAQKCVLELFRGLRFPPPSGGSATVVYPIAFTPGG